MKLLFDALSQGERDAIIDHNVNSKLPTKELNLSNAEKTSQNSDLKDDGSSSSPKTQGKKKVDEVENDAVRDLYNHYWAVY